MRVIITGSEPVPIHIGCDITQMLLLHEEADVLMAFHMITEATAGHSNINIVSDDTQTCWLS
jgi:hypothetical protein